MAVRLPHSFYTSDQLSELAEALDILERVFPDFDVCFEPKTPGKTPKAAPAATTVPAAKALPDNIDAASFRGKVIAATLEAKASVDDIAKATGIDQKRIRGVLNAPDLEFAKNRQNGAVRYQFIRTRERKRATREE